MINRKHSYVRRCTGLWLAAALPHSQQGRLDHEASSASVYFPRVRMLHSAPSVTLESPFVGVDTHSAHVCK